MAEYYLFKGRFSVEPSFYRLYKKTKDNRFIYITNKPYIEIETINLPECLNRISIWFIISHWKDITKREANTVYLKEIFNNPPPKDLR